MVDLNEFIKNQGGILPPDKTNEDENKILSPIGTLAPSPATEPPPVSLAVDTEVRDMQRAAEEELIPQGAVEDQPPRSTPVNIFAQPARGETPVGAEARQQLRSEVSSMRLKKAVEQKKIDALSAPPLVVFPKKPKREDDTERFFFSKDIARGLSQAQARARKAVGLSDTRTFRSSDGTVVTFEQADVAQNIANAIQTVRAKRINKGLTNDDDALVAMSDTQIINTAKNMATQLGGDPSIEAKYSALYAGAGGLARDVIGLAGIVAQSPRSIGRLVEAVLDSDISIDKTMQREFKNMGEMFDDFAEASGIPKTDEMKQLFLEGRGIKVDVDVASEILKPGRASGTLLDSATEYLIEAVGFLVGFKGVTKIAKLRRSKQFDRYVKANASAKVGREIKSVADLSDDEIILLARSVAETRIKAATRILPSARNKIREFRVGALARNYFKHGAKRRMAQEAKKNSMSMGEYRRKLYKETVSKYKQALVSLNKTERELASALKSGVEADIQKVKRLQINQMEELNKIATQRITLKNDWSPILNKENKELLYGELAIASSFGIASRVEEIEGTIFEPVLALTGALSSNKIIRLGSSSVKYSALAAAKATQNTLQAFFPLINKVPERTLVMYILGREAAFEGYVNAAGQFVRISRAERKALDEIDINLSNLSPEGRNSIAQYAAGLKQVFGRMEAAGLDVTKFSEAMSTISLVAPLRAVSDAMTDKAVMDLGSKSYLKDFVQTVETDLEVSQAVKALNSWYKENLSKVSANTAEGRELSQVFDALGNFVLQEQQKIGQRAKINADLIKKIVRAIEDGDKDPFTDFDRPDMPTEVLIEEYNALETQLRGLAEEFPSGALDAQRGQLDQAREVISAEQRIRVASASERQLDSEKARDNLATLALSRHSRIRHRFKQEYNNFFISNKDLKLDDDDLFDLIASVNQAESFRAGADVSGLGQLSSFEQIKLFTGNTVLPKNLRGLQKSFNTQAEQINKQTLEQLIEGTGLEPNEVLNRVKKMLRDDGIKKPSDVDIYGKLISLGEDAESLVFDAKLDLDGQVIREAQYVTFTPPTNQIQFSLRDVHDLKVYAGTEGRKFKGRLDPKQAAALRSFKDLSDLAEAGIKKGLEGAPEGSGYEAYASIGKRYRHQFSDRFSANRTIEKAIYSSKPKPLLGPRKEGLDFDYRSAGTSDNWAFLDLSKIKKQEDLDMLSADLENLFGEWDDAGNFVDFDPEVLPILQKNLQVAFYKGAVDQGFLRSTENINLSDVPLSEVERARLPVEGTEINLDSLEDFTSLKLNDKQVQGYLLYLNRSDQLFKKLGMTIDDSGLKHSIASLTAKNKSVRQLSDNYDEKIQEAVEQAQKTADMAVEQLRFDLGRTIEDQLFRTAGKAGDAGRFIDILRTNLQFAGESATGLNRIDDLVDNIYNNLNTQSSLYRRLSDMSELERRKEIKGVIRKKLEEEALSVSKGEVVGMGGIRGEDPLYEIDPKKLFEYLDNNEDLFVGILDGKEHYNLLRDFAEFTGRSGPFALKDIGMEIVTKTPGGMAMESLLSRAYAVNRGVISLKYVAGELLIRKMRVNKLNALKAMMANKETAEILSSVIRTGKMPSPKIQARLNTLLLSFIVREQIARDRNTRKTFDPVGGGLGVLDALIPMELPGDNRFVVEPSVGTTEEPPAVVN